MRATTLLTCCFYPVATGPQSVSRATSSVRAPTGAVAKFEFHHLRGSRPVHEACHV